MHGFDLFLLQVVQVGSELVELGRRQVGAVDDGGGVSMRLAA
jgi:hypothetical protein